MVRKKTKELEERLILFSIDCINIAENLVKNYIGNHIGYQLVKASTSSALNYGEVQGAESTKDFIHKMKIVLKELKETHINLRIIKLKPLTSINIDNAINEADELISIFVISLKTASKNLKK